MQSLTFSFITQSYCPSFADISIAHWRSLKSWTLSDCFLLFPAFLKEPYPILITQEEVAI